MAARVRFSKGQKSIFVVMYTKYQKLRLISKHFTDICLSDVSGHICMTCLFVNLKKVFLGIEISTLWPIFFYRPQRSWGKVMFSQACVILFTGGCLPQCMLGYTPREQTPPGTRHPPAADPPGADTPWQQTHPPAADPPPWQQTYIPPKACWEIRSTRGRYASYWNAILSRKFF